MTPEKHQIVAEPHNRMLPQWINEAWPASSWADLHVVLGVSGGPDSVAMLRAILALKQTTGGRGRLYVAHLNHQLRGAESDADEAWLMQLCRRLNVFLEVGKSDVAAIAKQKRISLEVAAREARYDYLRETGERLGARFVAVGHTADDQVETVLHRIVRGTGLAGLSGMAVARPLSSSITLVRPLLGVRRVAVLEYLRSLGQDFRTDVSNVDRRWTRNRLRNELLPLLREQFNTNVDEALLRLAVQAREAQAVVGDIALRVALECVEIERLKQPGAPEGARVSGVRIKCDPLRKQPPLLIREVCKHAWIRANWSQQAMGFDQWQQLAVLVLGDAEQPAIILPENTLARREGSFLVIQKFASS